jgi:hypothetical protein
MPEIKILSNEACCNFYSRIQGTDPAGEKIQVPNTCGYPTISNVTAYPNLQSCYENDNSSSNHKIECDEERKGSLFVPRTLLQGGSDMMH